MIKFIAAAILALVIVAPLHAEGLPGVMATGPATDGGKIVLASTTHEDCDEGEHVALYFAKNGKLEDGGCWGTVPELGIAVKWDKFGDFLYPYDMFTTTDALDEYVAKNRKAKATSL